MRFSDALDRTVQPQPGPRCTIAVALEHVDDPDAVRAAIGDRGITAKRIAEALNRALEGAPVPTIRYGTVQRHRNRECSCDG